MKSKLDNTIKIIEEIIKYGLSPNLKIDDKEKDLEINLIKIYSEYFKIQYEFDDTDYADFNKVKLPKISENVRANFPNFGLYHNVLNCHEFEKEEDMAISDAIDDLSDIIIDLIEIKWRKENNSNQDAMWFFELIFYSHTQQHLINLLNFMKSKNG